ncbi:MAG: hypothetical protein ABI591_04930 [Kofleriaceae bacterium]
MGDRTTRIWLLVASALCAVGLALGSPLRAISGDTVPGRLGAAVVRCGGGFDLDTVDWIHQATRKNTIYYFEQPDRADEHTSIFGPGPAAVGALGLLDFGEGDTIDDATLRHRERDVAAWLVALATCLVVVASRLRTTPWRSFVVGFTGAASFAGAASLGQGLWQATVALPALIGALATLVYAERHPRLALATPALLVAAVMVRPLLAPLCLALGVAWALSGRGGKRWLWAGALALVVAAPFVVWNVIHLWSPFPIGELRANARITDHAFRISPAGLVKGVGGLLVSPGRGLLWFAPIALVGLWYGATSKVRLHRLVAAGAILQLVVVGAFYKWHGGLAFGPRLLAEVTWLLTWLALGAGIFESPWRRTVRRCAVAITIAIGLLGLWRFRPEQWEARRMPDADETALWDPVDSPIRALFSHDRPQTQLDSPKSAGLRCAYGELHSIPP